MKRFCYRCGAFETDSGPLVQGLCQRCFSEQARLLEAPKEIQVIVCRGCNAYQLGKGWQTANEKESIEEIVKKVALSNVKVVKVEESGQKLLSPPGAPDVKINVEPDMGAGMVKIKAVGKVHELQAEPKSEEADIKLKLVKKSCEICSLKSAGYYEAILQVRGKLSREKLSKIKSSLEAMVLGTEQEFIIKAEERHGGLDLYVSSLLLARRMASLLKDNFRMGVSESAKLIGQTRDGRKKYRSTILAKLEERRR
ncbi:MAG: 60S ribosomal export protein NMD3 [Candidatus Hadarchaeota archaeon]